jgi:Rap1a immunity proteins
MAISGIGTVRALLISSVLLVVSSLECYAQTGNSSLAGCKAMIASSEGTYNFSQKEMFEIGYCTGVAATLLNIEGDVKWCPPDKATNLQLIRVIVAYLEAHPDKLNEGFIFLAMDALTQSWQPFFVIALSTGIILSAPVAHSQSLSSQAICAAQAKKMLEEWQASTKFILVSYSNHYNTKLGKCLMLIEYRQMVGGNPTQSKVLMDAFEERVYADYFWINTEKKKYWEVPPTNCHLTPSYGKTKDCKSEEEFDAFVAGYTEE